MYLPIDGVIERSRHDRIAELGQSDPGAAVAAYAVAQAMCGTNGHRTGI